MQINISPCGKSGKDGAKEKIKFGLWNWISKKKKKNSAFSCYMCAVWNVLLEQHSAALWAFFSFFRRAVFCSPKQSTWEGEFVRGHEIVMIRPKLKAWLNNDERKQTRNTVHSQHVELYLSQTIIFFFLPQSDYEKSPSIKYLQQSS